MATVSELASRDSSFSGPFVNKGKPIAEAFPNAFLGVLLPDADFRNAPRLRRGKKFDWLYDRAVGARVFERLMERCAWRDDLLLQQLVGERHHEHRAALICILTAGLALLGVAHRVGEEMGGWFWLPPRDLWQSWALDGLIADRTLAANVDA